MTVAAGATLECGSRVGLVAVGWLAWLSERLARVVRSRPWVVPVLTRGDRSADRRSWRRVGGRLALMPSPPKLLQGLRAPCARAALGQHEETEQHRHTRSGRADADRCRLRNRGVWGEGFYHRVARQRHRMAGTLQRRARLFPRSVTPTRWSCAPPRSRRSNTVATRAAHTDSGTIITSSSLASPMLPSRVGDSLQAHPGSQEAFTAIDDTIDGSQPG